MTSGASIISVDQARELAVRVHAGQRDRDGSLHIDHVARVVRAVAGDASHQRVAWLHDVIEDGELTFESLRSRITENELQALRLLTRDQAESYEDYVRRLVDAPGAAGELARAVKQADMLDNLRRCARDHDPAVAQYGRALSALWTAHP